MTELSRPESQYDAFLFASVCETDEMTLSVLSVLARQDVDPWQEAARLAQLPRDQAIRQPCFANTEIEKPAVVAVGSEHTGGSIDRASAFT